MRCWVPLCVSLPLAGICLILAGAAGLFLGTCLQAAPEDFYTPGPFGTWSRVQGMAVDGAGGYLYMTEVVVDDDDLPMSVGRILRVGVSDASATELNISGLLQPHGLALDRSLGMMYWADSAAGKIQRMSFDSSIVEDVVTGLASPSCVAVIPGEPDADGVFGRNGYVFWVDVDTNGDGEHTETRVQGARVPRGSITAEPRVEMVQVVTHGGWGSLVVVPGLAADASGGELDWRVYWTRADTGMIQSASAAVFDGGTMDVLTGLISPGALEIATDGSFMYWIAAGRIQSANDFQQLQDATVENDAADIFVSPVNPLGLAMDKEADLLYWADSRSLRRSDHLGECIVYQLVNASLRDQSLFFSNIILGVVLGISFPCFCVWAACVVRKPKGGAEGDVGPSADSSDARAAGKPITSDDIGLIVPDIANRPANRTGTAELRTAVQTAARDANREWAQRGATRLGRNGPAFVADSAEGPDVELVRDGNAKCCLFCTSG